MRSADLTITSAPFRRMRDAAARCDRVAIGCIESGQLANMRTYRLPPFARVHVRLLGEGKTLCGRSLRHNDEYAFQFIHRGNVLEGSVPSGAYPSDRDACARCCASPLMRACQVISDARRNAVLGMGRRGGAGRRGKVAA